MTPKHLSQPSGKDPLTQRRRSKRSSSFAIFLLPGWYQLRMGRRFFGLLAVCLTFTVSLLLGTCVYLVLLDRDTLLNLITNSSAMNAAGVLIASLGVLSFTLGVIDMAELSRNRGKRSKWWLILIAAYSVIQLVVALLVANLAFSQVTFLRAISVPVTGPTTPGTIEVDPLSGLDRVNVLLLGGDAGDGRIGLRPDSISILSVDVESGQVTIIGIPRNLQNAIFSEGSPLYGPFPKGYDCGKSCLISYLYTYGVNNPQLYDSAEFVGRNPGVEATRDAVEGVTGLEIPYSVLIDMRGFEALVNSVGGIEVCVPVSTSTRDGSMVFIEGCQHMNGTQALAYSRIRSDSDDYNRMSKQRLVQTALIEQINPLNLALGFQTIASLSGSFVQTDIPEGEISHLLKLALRSSNFKPQTLELVPPIVNVINPDFEDIQQLVRDIGR